MKLATKKIFKLYLIYLLVISVLIVQNPAPAQALAPLLTYKEIELIESNFAANNRMDGDIDGDGINDLIIGSWGYSTETGRILIYYGGSGFTGTPDTYITGEGVSNRFGDGLDVGDFNGDGIDDIAAGAVRYNAYAGRAYVFYGGTRAHWQSITNANQADVKVTGAATSHLGNKVDIGDIDSDGYGDFLVGAEQHANYGAYLLYGSANTGITKNWNEMDVVFNNDFPFGLSSLGEDVYIADVLGDGNGDLIICAGDWLGEGGDHSGIIVFAGADNAKTTLAGNINASTANLKVWGYGDYKTLGYPVKSGDINGDGKGDIISGVDRFGMAGLGKLVVIYGSTSLSGEYEVQNIADVIIDGEVSSDLFGMASMAGDLNRDGYDDIVTSANFYPTVWVGPGRMYVFYGGPAIESKATADQAEYVFDNPTGKGRIGWWVAVGDINNDGWLEFGSAGRNAANLWGVYYIWELSHDAPSVAITAAQTTMSEDGFIEISGTATDPDGGNIRKVEYSIDKSSWSPATPSDGNFDSPNESYSFRIYGSKCVQVSSQAVGLSPGNYTVYIRSTDSEGATTAEANYASQDFTVSAMASESPTTTAPAIAILPETGPSFGELYYELKFAINNLISPFQLII